ncbi:MAG: PAS domain S-box protein, partial [Anaerolineales bacterium]|nr:PAS domain S-box protein [Anaerolineales bacterium]
SERERYDSERKRAESERRYRSVVEDQTELICRYDKDFKLRFANEAYAQSYGMSPVEMIGKSVLDRIPASDRERAVAHVRSLTALNPVASSEHQSVMPDQSIRWFQWTDRALLDDAGNIIEYQGVGRDITARKQAEDALFEMEYRLRLFVEHAPAAIAMFDQNMHYLLVSQRWLRDYQLKDSDVIGRSHYDIFPDIPEGWKEIHQRCLRGAIESSAADPFPRADGRTDWVRWEIRPWHDVKGEIGGILLFSEVITERIESERALSQTNQRLNILHQIDQLVLSSDSMDELTTASLDGLLTLIPAKRAALFRFNTDQRTGIVLGLQTQNGAPKPELPRHISMDHPNMIDQEVFGALFEKKYHLIQNLHEYPAEEWENLAQEGIQSILSVSLNYRSQLIGGLFIYGPETDFFTAERVQVATEIAIQLAIGISNHEQSEQLRHYTAELEQRVQQRTAELQGEKERVEVILNNSPDAILLLDDDLNIVQANRQFTAVFGCSQEHCVGNSLLMLTESEHEAQLRAFIEDRRAQESGSILELTAVRHDGSTFEAELSMGMIQGEGLVCVIRDISERKVQDRQLS